MRAHLSSAFYGVDDQEAFVGAVQQVLDRISTKGVFAGDNLITFGKNLSFLDDEKFMAAHRAQATEAEEQASIWRAYTLAWAARRALAIEGDFVECGCYRGTSARILADYLDLGASDKSFWLYDLFEHDAAMLHHDMPRHGEGLYREVCARFADLPNFHVVQGKVPDSLDGTAPARIAFLHIDMNNALAELGALKVLFERMSAGGSIVLDDYGWHFYRPQKLSADLFFRDHGYQVLELPTGQGLVIK